MLAPSEITMFFDRFRTAEKLLREALLQQFLAVLTFHVNNFYKIILYIPPRSCLAPIFSLDVKPISYNSSTLTNYEKAAYPN